MGAGRNSPFSFTCRVYSPSKPCHFFAAILTTLPASPLHSHCLVLRSFTPAWTVPPAWNSPTPAAHLVLFLQRNHVAPPARPSLLLFRPFIGFPFFSFNSKHLSRKQSPPAPGDHWLSHLSSLTPLLPAGFAKQRASLSKDCIFSPPILKNYGKIHQHKRVFKQLLSLHLEASWLLFVFQNQVRASFSIKLFYHLPLVWLLWYLSVFP